MAKNEKKNSESIIPDPAAEVQGKKKKNKSLTADEIDEIKNKRFTAIFRVELLEGMRGKFDRVRVDEPPMDRVKSVDVNRLLLDQPGVRRVLTSADGERLAVTYTGQLSTNELKARLGYVYVLHAVSTSALNAPVRNIKDLSDLILEANFAPMVIEVINEEAAQTELASLTDNKRISKVATIVHDQRDELKMHVCHRVQPAGEEIVSLCGVVAVKTNIPYLAWGSGVVKDRTWCKLCHAISIHLEGIK